MHSVKLERLPSLLFNIFPAIIKVKVHFTLEQTTRAQMGSRVIASFFFLSWGIPVVCVTWKVQCKGVKHNKLICNTDINWTTCFGLLRDHHQVQQALWRHIYYMEFKLVDVEISSSIFSILRNMRRKLLGAKLRRCVDTENSWGQRLDCDVTLYWRLLSLVVSTCGRQ